MDAIGGEVVERPSGLRKLPVRITDPDRRSSRAQPSNPGIVAGAQEPVRVTTKAVRPSGASVTPATGPSSCTGLPAADNVEASSSATLPFTSLTAIVWPPLA